jgi:transposase
MVLGKHSILSVPTAHGMNKGLLYQSIKKYKLEGHEGLASLKKSRPPKESSMEKKVEAKELNESEREELLRLRAQTAYLEARMRL